MNFVRCHVDLNRVADAVELPIREGDHVAAETEKAAYLHPDGGLAARVRDYAVNRAKVGPIRRLGSKPDQITASGCRTFLLSRRCRRRCRRRSGLWFRRCRWACWGWRGCG